MYTRWQTTSSPERTHVKYRVWRTAKVTEVPDAPLGIFIPLKMRNLSHSFAVLVLGIAYPVLMNANPAANKSPANNLIGGSFPPDGRWAANRAPMNEVHMTGQHGCSAVLC